MIEEDKFKEELNRVIESKSFDFDETNWHKMQAMMPKQKPWYHTFKQHLVLSSIVLLLLVSGVSYLLLSNHTSNADHKIKSSINSESTDIVKAENINTEKLSLKDIDATKSNPIILEKESETDFKNKESINKSVIKNSSTDISEKIKNTSQQNIPPIASTDKSRNIANDQDKKEARMVSIKTVSEKNSNKRGIQLSKTKQASAASLEIHQEEKVKNNLINSKTDLLITTIKSNGNTESNILADADEKKEVDYSANTLELNLVSKKDKRKQSVSLNNIESNSLDNNYSIKTNASLYSDSNRPFVRRINANLALDSVNEIAKVLQTIAIDSAAIANRMRPKIKHVVALEAGTSYMFGWKDNQGKDANGFNPVIGLNYAYQFSQHLFISFGMQYTSIGNIRNTDYTAKRVKYNFGEEIDYTTISAKNMYYLLLPMKLSYRTNIKNEVGVGFNLGYLLDVKSNVATYSKRFNVVSAPVNAKSNGYKGGFHSLDAQLALFYRRRLASRLAVHSEFIYGVLDIKNDKYFKPVSFDRNIGLKLTLVYDIFKK
jgi:hypothetical protein